MNQAVSSQRSANKNQLKVLRVKKMRQPEIVRKRTESELQMSPWLNAEC
jgi:hypothetical protein